MADSIEHKRGNFFSIDCQYTDSKNTPLSLENITIKAQIRNSSDRLVDELIVTPIDLPIGKYRLTSADTSKWQIGVLNFDIQYTLSDGKVTSTDTVSITCLKDETR